MGAERRTIAAQVRDTSGAVLPGVTGFRTVTREGIELTSGFTANVDADLQVGAVEETITVSGQTPVVDVQNATQTMARI